MAWDRSKQTYWILRRGNPWKVINMLTDEIVSDFPAFNYDHNLTEAICFAKDNKKVKELLDEKNKL